jgi:hypothetical protein
LPLLPPPLLLLSVLARLVGGSPSAAAAAALLVFAAASLGAPTAAAAQCCSAAATCAGVLQAVTPAKPSLTAGRPGRGSRTPAQQCRTVEGMPDASGDMLRVGLYRHKMLKALSCTGQNQPTPSSCTHKSKQPQVTPAPTWLEGCLITGSMLRVSR